MKIVSMLNKNIFVQFKLIILCKTSLNFEKAIKMLLGTHGEK